MNETFNETFNETLNETFNETFNGTFNETFNGTFNGTWNQSWNESYLELFPGRLTVSPFTLISEDREFYVAVASIIIASAILPNGYIIVQILR